MLGRALEKSADIILIKLRVTMMSEILVSRGDEYCQVYE
jgi:hypothetical protein